MKIFPISFLPFCTFLSLDPLLWYSYGSNRNSGAHMTSDHPHLDRWLQYMKQWSKDDLCSKGKVGFVYYDMDLVLVDTLQLMHWLFRLLPSPKCQCN